MPNLDTPTVAYPLLPQVAAFLHQRLQRKLCLLVQVGVLRTDDAKARLLQERALALPRLH